MKSKAYDLLLTNADKAPPDKQVAAETLEEVAARIATRAVGRNPNCETRRKLCEQAILSALRNERERCARAICPFCAQPKSYGPAHEIEGSKRLWYRDLNNRENGVEQCLAAAIREGR